MPTCPAGHQSTTDDYCDTCGAPIGAAPAVEGPGAAAAPPPPSAPPPPEAGESTSGEPGPAAPEPASGGPGPAAAAAPPPGSAAPGSTAPPASPGAAPEACPSCGEPVAGRFCESCGYDVEKGAPAPPRPVTLVLSADRAHWERMVGEGEPAFPAAVPSLTLELTGDRATLGRIRTGAAVDVDLALTGSAADPAVSHHQCAFEHDGDGWSVTDLDSANGTWINDAGEPLGDGERHRLADGDRILMGAWTCLTVRDAPATPATAEPGVAGSAEPSGTGPSGTGPSGTGPSGTAPPGDPSAPEPS